MGSIDNFFYYGEGNLRDEIRNDIIEGLVQPRNTLYYARELGAGLSGFENFPGGLLLEIGIRYTVVDFIARRNQLVSDGTNGTPDRRVAVSQHSVGIQRDNMGNITVTIYYVPFADYENPDTIQIPIGAIA